MKYKIIKQGYIDHLENSIQLYCNDGWEPKGGILFTSGQYFQAIIKKEPTSEKPVEPIVNPCICGYNCGGDDCR